MFMFPDAIVSLLTDVEDERDGSRVVVVREVASLRSWMERDKVET